MTLHISGAEQTCCLRQDAVAVLYIHPTPHSLISKEFLSSTHFLNRLILPVLQSSTRLGSGQQRTSNIHPAPADALCQGKSSSSNGGSSSSSISNSRRGAAVVQSRRALSCLPRLNELHPASTLSSIQHNRHQSTLPRAQG